MLDRQFGSSSLRSIANRDWRFYKPTKCSVANQLVAGNVCYERQGTEFLTCRSMCNSRSSPTNTDNDTSRRPRRPRSYFLRKGWLWWTRLNKRRNATITTTATPVCVLKTHNKWCQNKHQVVWYSTTRTPNLQQVSSLLLMYRTVAHGGVYRLPGNIALSCDGWFMIKHWPCAGLCRDTWLGWRCLWLTAWLKCCLPLVLPYLVSLVVFVCLVSFVSPLVLVALVPLGTCALGTSAWYLLGLVCEATYYLHLCLRLGTCVLSLAWPCHLRLDTCACGLALVAWHLRLGSCILVVPFCLCDVTCYLWKNLICLNTCSVLCQIVLLSYFQNLLDCKAASSQIWFRVLRH